MALLVARYRRADWGGLQGGQGVASRIQDDFTVLPPDSRWDRSIRIRLQDGDVAPWASNLEVAQVQASSHHPINTNRWIETWIRYNQVAAYDNLDFHFSYEVHTQGATTSAPWAENLTTSQRQLRRTPTGFNHVWPASARTPLNLGVWQHHIIGFRNTTGTDGFAEWWLNGTRLYYETGIRTSGDGTSWYPKIGFYRWASISGTDDAHIAGFAIHDSLPTYPGSTPAPTISVTIDTPAASGGIFVGSLPYQVTVDNAPAGSTLYTGLGALGVFDEDPALSGDSVQTGTLDLSAAPVGGRTDGFYSALHDSGGIQVAVDTAAVTVFPEETTPPPVDPIELSMEIDVTTDVTIGLDYETPGDVTIPASDVIGRVPGSSTGLDIEVAARLLDAAEFVLSPPIHYFHRTTDERLTRRTDGTFTTYQE